MLVEYRLITSSKKIQYCSCTVLTRLLLSSIIRHKDMIKNVANETLNYSIALCREKEVKGFIIDFHIRRYLNLHKTCTFTVCRV